jgi:hypothetical protein
MTSINVKLTIEEVELLSSLASDQLFRREFIDPKMPGHRANPGALRLGKQLVERLQGISDEAKGPRQARRNAPTTRNGDPGTSAEKQKPIDTELT